MPLQKSGMTIFPDGTVEIDGCLVATTAKEREQNKETVDAIDQLIEDVEPEPRADGN